MRGALLVLLAGCNPVFGIDSTRLIDAPPDSPPIDAPAPFTCPPVGTMPAFGVDLTMVLAPSTCSGLVTDATGGYLAAMCQDESKKPSVFAGPAGSPLGKLAVNVEPVSPYSVRLAPEGDRLFVHESERDPVNGTYDHRVIEYSRVGDIWMRGAAFGPPGALPTQYFLLGQPTRGPVRRMVWARNVSLTAYELVEFEWNGTVATEVFVASLPSLEYWTVDHVSLTGDGLRLVMTASNLGWGGGPMPLNSGSVDPVIITYEGDAPVYYMDRATMADPFTGDPKLLDSVPNRVTSPVMTEDCGRVYFGALDRYWYLEQPRP